MDGTNLVRSGEIKAIHCRHSIYTSYFHFSQVLEAIAGIKQEPKEKLAELYYQNTLDLFFPKEKWNTNQKLHLMLLHLLYVFIVSHVS